MSIGVMYLLLLLGIIPIIVSGILSGTFVSGERVRANYSDSTDFIRRTKIGSMFFLFGLPCLRRKERCSGEIVQIATLCRRVLWESVPGFARRTASHNVP